MNDKIGVKIAGIGLTLLVVALGFMVCVDKDSNQIWAAWIQAIGSILAICYAFYIADGENRRREARDAQEQVDRLSRLEAIAKYVVHLSSVIEAESRKSSAWKATGTLLHSVESAKELVAQINIETISGVDQILAWLEVRQVIVEFEAALTSGSQVRQAHYEALCNRAVKAKLAFVKAE